MVYIPARLCLAFLAASGTMVIYVTRTIMSVAVVAMYQTSSNQKATDGKFVAMIPYCLRNNTPENDLNFANTTDSSDMLYETTTLGKLTSSMASVVGSSSIESIITTTAASISEDPIFITSAQRGAILGGFYYGYMAGMMPGGFIADKYGTKRVFGASVFICIILDLLSPMCAKVHYGLLIALRVLAGIAQAPCYPSLSGLMSRWIPTAERPAFMSFTYLWANFEKHGERNNEEITVQTNCIGIIITLPMSGIIISNFGWEAVFYASALVSFFWLVVWWNLAYDIPDDHPRISKTEMKFILDGMGHSRGGHNRPSKTPWLKMLKSGPFWAYTSAHTGGIIGWSVLSTQLPTYLSTIMGLEIKKNSAMSSIPFVGRFLGSNIFGILATCILRKGWLLRKTSARIFTVIGLLLPAVAMILNSIIECNAVYTIAVITLGAAFNGAISGGHGPNLLDLSPNFSGTLLGMGSTFAFMFGMCAPVVIGALTSNETFSEWATVFRITAGTYTAAGLVFIIFGSYEIQEWNFSNERTDDEKKENGKEETELEKLNADDRP